MGVIECRVRVSSTSQVHVVAQRNLLQTNSGLLPGPIQGSMLFCVMVM